MLPPLQTVVFDSAIAGTIARDLQANACLEDFRQMSPPELAGVIDNLVQAYTRWVAGDQGQVAKCSRNCADLSFQLSVPSVETAYALFLLRDGLLASISVESEKGHGRAYPRLTEFFNLVTLDLLERF